MEPCRVETWSFESKRKHSSYERESYNGHSSLELITHTHLQYGQSNYVSVSHSSFPSLTSAPYNYDLNSYTKDLYNNTASVSMFGLTLKHLLWLYWFKILKSLFLFFGGRVSNFDHDASLTSFISYSNALIMCTQFTFLYTYPAYKNDWPLIFFVQLPRFLPASVHLPHLITNVSSFFPVFTTSSCLSPRVSVRATPDKELDIRRKALPLMSKQHKNPGEKDTDTQLSISPSLPFSNCLAVLFALSPEKKHAVVKSSKTQPLYAAVFFQLFSL